MPDAENTASKVARFAQVTQPGPSAGRSILGRGILFCGVVVVVLSALGLLRSLGGGGFGNYAFFFMLLAVVVVGLPLATFLIALGIALQWPEWARGMAVLAFGTIVAVVLLPRFGVFHRNWGMSPLCWSILIALLVLAPVAWLARDERAALGWGSLIAGFACLTLPTTISQLSDPGYHIAAVVFGAGLLAAGAGTLLTQPRVAVAKPSGRAWGLLAVGLVLRSPLPFLACWAKTAEVIGTSLPHDLRAAIDSVATILGPVLTVMGVAWLTQGHRTAGLLRGLLGWAVLATGLVLLSPLVPGLRIMVKLSGGGVSAHVVDVLVPVLLVAGPVLTVLGVGVLRAGRRRAVTRSTVRPGA